MKKGKYLIKLLGLMSPKGTLYLDMDNQLNKCLMNEFVVLNRKAKELERVCRTILIIADMVLLKGEELEYIAHKRLGEDGKAILESVREHAILTANLISQYSRGIIPLKNAQIIALLHDAGKMTSKFQDVIMKGRTGINHAILGASILFDDYRTSFPSDAEMILAYNAIRAHHVGLRDDMPLDEYNEALEDIEWESEEIKKDFKRSIDGKENCLSCTQEIENARKKAEELIKRAGVVIDESYDTSLSTEYTSEEFMLRERLILSCLVDSDYTATACFMNCMKPQDDAVLQYDKLLNALNCYRRNIVMTSDQQLPINILRNKVWEEADRTGRKAEPGLYTMTAPTGTAKTLSLIKFALECAKRNHQKRVIVVLPYLSITEQNTKIYKDCFGEENVVEADSITEYDAATKLKAERWDAPIIITTNVGFYETLFSSNTVQLRKLHRATDAVVVFDESQTIPYDRAGVTMRTLMILARYKTTVLLSTATQPRYNYREDIDYHPIEVIEDVDALYEEYEKIHQVNTAIETSEISFQEIAKRYKNRHQVLYMVNTIKQAIDLYEAVKDEVGKEDTFLVSTNQCRMDRQRITNEVAGRLKNGRSVHLVSTQCLECGVDFDFPVGCRARAPLSALLQFMGRINRNGKAVGEMLIFIPEGENRYSFPNVEYQNQTLYTSAILKKIGAKEIERLETSNIYFKKLFAEDGVNSQDATKINDALKDVRFETMSKAYKLINDEGKANIIVCSQNDEKIYDKLFDELRQGDFVISRRMMAEARQICVSVSENAGRYRPLFESKDVVQLYERGAFGESHPINWYILTGKELYSEDIGLIAPRTVPDDSKEWIV